MSEGSPGRTRGVVLLGGGIICLTGFLLLTAIVTRDILASTDQLARMLVHGSQHPFLSPLMEGASFLGGQPGQIAVILLASAVLWSRRPRRWALALPVVMAGAALIQYLAKWHFDRPRPNLDPWGFPSAHVMTLVVLFGYLGYVLVAGATARRRRWWRALAVSGCPAVVCTVAYSRMYLDAHWLSDVLGGMSGGLAYLLLAIWLIGSGPSPAVASLPVVPTPASEPPWPLSS
jgi:membrane-associated phospholipid phosphatase